MAGFRRECEFHRMFGLCSVRVFVGPPVRRARNPAAARGPAADEMAPKRKVSPAGSDWLERTHARTCDPGSAGGGQARGAKRWTEAAEVFVEDLKRGRMPDLPGVSSSGSAAASGSGDPSPVPGYTPDELKNLMSNYARSVLSMKPVGFDPFGYTKIIRGRPVQVLLGCFW